MRFCQRHDLIDRQSYVAQYLSLAILTIGLTTLLGCDDLLAAFACGTSFAWDGFFNRQTEESVFSSVIDTLFNVAAFIFVGAWMPFGQFHLNVQNGIDGMGAVQAWRLVVLAILVLLLRRLPIMMMMYRWIPDVKTWREAVFSGHFGPMGIGAIFISTFANQFLVEYMASNPSTTASNDQQHQLEMVKQMVQPIVAFMVICSITIHGLSIPGFSLGRRVHSVSRTWSRRDTIGSRIGAPDWTNQAILVTRAEDIVINRDLERGDEGRGDEKTMTMSKPTLTNGQKDDGSNSDGMTEEQRVPIPAPAQNQDEDDCRNQFPPDGKLENGWKVIRESSKGIWVDPEMMYVFLPFLSPSCFHHNINQIIDIWLIKQMFPANRNSLMHGNGHRQTI
jgi:sodium/hydrogen antiporter